VNGKILILEENQDLEFNNTDFQSGYMKNISRNNLNVGSIPVNDLIIDKAAYIVYLDGSRISFPKKEFELLLLLASNPRKVFKRQEILLQIWGKDFKPKDSRSLDVHIRMLRKKLENRFITTLRGVGYKLEKN